MKLIQAIVHADDAKAVVDALIRKGFGATYTVSTGGFLGLTSVTVISGVDEEKLETALKVIKENVSSRKGLPQHGDKTRPVDVSGAVFVVDVDRFERL
ncbi:hypothetical protein AMJ40_03480 [candidate division TA06 bacterium DG_26]|uniref:Transcriptional regulator n=1 Tax=candidate division TA06 bacterium DG_26 TaxID=1703771 RepID=A0A0S7WJD4_UNCT6|nr:MAG: hypothetical protein AMJ40_03480 [candidate division TA06 bacterium DG_26]